MFTKAAGAGIEPASPGSKPGIVTSSDYPASVSEGRAGLEPARWCLTGTCSAAELPTRSTECPVGIEPTSPAWKAGTFAARPRAHSSFSCGGRNRTCVRAVNSRLPVPARVPPQWKTTVRTAGFEPAVSCARSTRIARLSHVLKEERPAGVEPARPPWQGGRQPLHHGRVLRSPNCQRARAPGGTRTHVAALRVRNLGR